MAGQLELQLLGGCQIAYQGELLTELTLNKARALLAYLAVTKRGHTRAHLIDLLWTELPESAARRNLRVVLTKVRQSVGDQMAVTRTHVALRDNDHCVVDVEKLAVAEKVLHTKAEPWDGATVTTLAAAFNAYRGDFLDGFEAQHAPAFEEWMLLERERLRQLAFQIGERLVQHYASTDKVATAIPLCQSLLQIEPWHETIHRRLMALFVRSGQPTAALQQYERCRRLLAEELAVEPEAATQALYTQIRHDIEAGEENDRSLRPLIERTGLQPAPGSGLPTPTTPFLGRATELAKLATLLANPACRLLTLVGPGGIGKTRLAQELARRFDSSVAAGRREVDSAIQHHQRFSDGLYFVGASSLPTIDDLVSAIAMALGIVFAGQDTPETQLLNQLATRQLLLILDNLEHLTPEADRLNRWLAQSPGLTLLVTSRERLNLSDEWLFPVQGLPVPSATDAVATLVDNEAIQLFVRRAQRVNLGFTVPLDSSTERTALIAICRLLEGMPLALELAAAWARTHSCVEILLEIQANLDFLASDLRDIPARHRSLRATFDHSWQLLGRADARILQRLVLLPAGFRITFARQVAQTTPAALMRLVDKSLLQRNPGGRYTLHELLRQYIMQQVSSKEQVDTYLRYLRAYGPWVQELRDACESANEPQALDDFGAEFENLRAIWQWLLVTFAPSFPAQGIDVAEQKEVQEELVEALQRYLPMFTYFYIRRSRYSDGLDFLTDAKDKVERAGWSVATLGQPNQQSGGHSQGGKFLAMLTVALADIRFHLSEFPLVAQLVQGVLPTLRRYGEPTEVANALAVLGKTQIRMGLYAEAEETLQESLDLFQKSGKHKESTAALNALGILHSNQGHFVKAAAYYEQYLAIAREYGYQRGIANALNNLGTNYARNGEHERALPYYRETYAMAQIIDERLMLGVALSNLGSVERALGHFSAARGYYKESLIHCRAIGERRWTTAGLNGLGLTLFEEGQAEAAIPYFAEALAIAETINSAPDLLDAIAGLSLVQANNAPTDVTATLLAFVTKHPITQTLSRQRCHECLQQMQELLPQEGYQRALVSAATLDIAGALALVRKEFVVAIGRHPHAKALIYRDS